MKAPDPTLPPWTATCQRDRDWMVRWVIEQLDAEDAERERRDQEVSETRDPARVIARVRADLKLGIAKHAASLGNFEPLRKLFPEIAAYINAPKRRQGQHRSYPKAAAFERYGQEDLVEDVARVRQLWRQHYDGKWKRSHGQTA